MGQSAVVFEPDDVTIDLQGVTIFRRGTPVEFNWAELRRAMKHKEISIDISMGDGPGRARVWTCDLGHGYIEINAAYN